MGLIAQLGRYAWRKYVLDGVSASGFHEPVQEDIFAFVDKVDDTVGAVAAAENVRGEWDASSGTFPGGGTAALGDTWLVTTAGTMGGRFFGVGDKLVAVKANPSATVYATNWGTISAPGKGYEPGMDAGAGTANAIIVTTDKAVGDGQVVMFPLYRDTTGSPVTVSINGGAALTLKTNRGNNASALTAGMDIWGRIRTSDNTFRLLNDQDVSVLVGQAEEARDEVLLALEAADLPPITNGTMMVDLDDDRQSKTFEEVRELLEVPSEPEIGEITDPLNNFYADGETDDTTNFTSMRANPRWEKAEIDLRGSTYLVSDIPDGPFRRGFFRKLNAVGDLTVDFPAPDTLDATTVKLTTGRRYAAWTQDKCFIYKGVMYAFWNEGEGHTSLDTHVRCARSYDGGQTWTNYERLFQSSTREAMSFAAGVMDGQQLIVVRERTLGPNTVQGFKLYGRRSEERRAQVSARVVCTNGSANIDLYIADAGVKAGDQITLLGVSATVGGLTLSDKTFTVAYQDGPYFRFTSTSGGLGNAGSSEDKTITFDIAFHEGSFTELQFRVSGVDVSLGEAIVAYGTPFTALPSVIQSIAAVRTSTADNGIKLYMGVSGSVGGGVVLMEITGLLRGTVQRSISNATKIGLTTSGLAEPTVCADPDTGDLFGFARSQDPSVPAQFWWAPASDRTDTTTVSLPAGSEAWYLSPIPCRVYGDNIYALLVGDRENNDTVGPVPAHLLIADKSEAKAASDFSPWRAIRLGELTHAVETASDAVGVPSMLIDEEARRLCLFYSDEGYPLPGSPATSGTTADIYCTMIGLDPIIGGDREQVQKVLGRAAIKHARGAGGMAADVGYFEEVKGSNSVAAWGQIAADGTITAGYNIASVSKGSTGIYTVTFKKPISGIAAAIPTARWTGNQINAGVSDAPTSTGFSYRCRDVTNTLTDAPVHFVVLAREDRYRAF